MRKKRAHIHQIITVILLAVFSLAILPWNVVHKHDAPLSRSIAEKHCTHKEHIQSYQEQCLICNAHFEKSYTVQQKSFSLIVDKPADLHFSPICQTAYVELIATSLRGPPSLIV